MSEEEIQVDITETLASAARIVSLVASGSVSAASAALAEDAFAGSRGQTASVASSVAGKTSALALNIDELSTRTAALLEHAAEYFNDTDASLAQGFGG